eukprot:6160749-Prymnesium_polylepis.1
MMKLSRIEAAKFVAGDKESGLRSCKKQQLVASVGEGIVGAMELTLGEIHGQRWVFGAPPTATSGPETGDKTNPLKPRNFNPTGNARHKFDVGSLLPADFEAEQMQELPTYVTAKVKQGNLTTVVSSDDLMHMSTGVAKCMIRMAGVVQQDGGATEQPGPIALFDRLCLLSAAQFPMVPRVKNPRKKKKNAHADEPDHVQLAPLPFYKKVYKEKMQNVRGWAHSEVNQLV